MELPFIFIIHSTPSNTEFWQQKSWRQSLTLGLLYWLIFSRGSCHRSHTHTLAHTYSWGLSRLLMKVQNCHLLN